MRTLPAAADRRPLGATVVDDDVVALQQLPQQVHQQCAGLFRARQVDDVEQLAWR